jgi:hypothetical protein
MGGNSSRENIIIEEQKMRAEALKRYDMRIRLYRYEYHGPYCEYIEWCRGQYELECIPQICRQCANYRPEYDHWGRQIY